MFFVTRQRTFVRILFAFILLLCVSTLRADTWKGTRYDGNACNRYFLTISARNGEYEYSQAFRNAIGIWRNATSPFGLNSVPRVHANMFERTTWIGGNDRCYVVDKGEDKGRLGLTWYYKKVGSSGRNYNITDGDPVDKSWYFCTITLFKNVHSSASRDDEELLLLATDTATHEMGHSLKLAHANANEGSERNNISPNGQRSIMESETDPDNLSGTVTPYDLQELRLKWNN